MGFTMQFTNNFNAAVVVYIYNLQDPIYYTALRDPNSVIAIGLTARAETIVGATTQVTFTHPNDPAWLIGVKLDTFWGRLGPFIAPLPNKIFDASTEVELTATGTLIWRNAVVATVPTPRLTEAELNRPLPQIKGHLIGVGRANITDMAVVDPKSAISLQGWASPSQLSGALELDSNGNALPLMARAFIVADPLSHSRAVFVVADMWSCSIAVKQEVVRRLSFGLTESPYQAANITIAGTHTHSGPAGYLHHFLYNATAGGFDKHVFESMVSGIVRAIEIAHTNLASGRVTVLQQKLENITRNRSMAAFDNNPATMTARFPNTVIG